MHARVLIVALLAAVSSAHSALAEEDTATSCASGSACQKECANALRRGSRLPVRLDDVCTRSCVAGMGRACNQKAATFLADAAEDDEGERSRSIGLGFLALACTASEPIAGACATLANELGRAGQKGKDAGADAPEPDDVTRLLAHAALSGEQSAARSVCSSLVPRLVEETHQMEATDDRWKKLEAHHCDEFFQCVWMARGSERVGDCAERWTRAFAGNLSTSTLEPRRREIIRDFMQSASTSAADGLSASLRAEVRKVPRRSAPSRAVAPVALDLGYARVHVRDENGLEYDLMVGKTEVTNEQYEKCVRAGACRAPDFGPVSRNWEPGKPLPLGSASILKKIESMSTTRPRRGREKHPVNGVYQTDAASFCKWAGASLPSEIEWNAVASSIGPPWGEGRADASLAHVADDTKPNAKAPATTAPVCSKKKGVSTEGVCDLWGNVWEWTSTEPKLRQPPGQSIVGTPFVIKGGGYGTTAAELRTILADFSTTEGADRGFRCVLHLNASGDGPRVLAENDYLRVRLHDDPRVSSCMPTDAPDQQQINDCATDCKLGFIDSCESLVGIAASLGAKSAVATTTKIATEPLQAACDGERGLPSCVALANLLELSGKREAAKKTRDAANARAEQACNDGDPDACADVGLALMGRAEAIRPLKSACKAGVAISCARLAAVFTAGMGVPVDAAQAQKFYALGCSFGDQPSCAMSKAKRR